MPGRLVLSQAWIRAGLTPPEALAWQDGGPQDDLIAGPGFVDPLQLEQMIDDMRRGVSGGAAPRPWTVHTVLATLPDGTGSQSLAVAAQRDRQRALAMLLLKQDFGVKDAYLILCPSATEQRSIMATLEDETGAMSNHAGLSGCRP